jgi:hypothetical protein
MKSSLCAVLALLATLATPAFAWNSFGHMEVAAVAWSQLTPTAKKDATDLLKLNTQYKTWIAGVAAAQQDQIGFVKAATWPDEIKTLTGYTNDGSRGGDVAPKTPEASQNVGYADHNRHRYWHFIDEPFSTDGTPLQQPVAPNAQTEIAIFRNTIGDKTVSADIRSYDLAWLLHLVGDVHQPLHATSRFTHTEPNEDEGGNTVKIKCSACQDSTELHAFWDNLLGPEKGSPQSAIESAAALPAASATQASQMDETDWIDESFTIAKKSVYQTPIGDTDGPFNITKAYQAGALKIAKEQIALAGARLANLLNASLK